MAHNADSPSPPPDISATCQPLDITAYPHIFDLVFDFAPRESLLALRGTSKRIRDRADVRLHFGHFAIADGGCFGDFAYPFPGVDGQHPPPYPEHLLANQTRLIDALQHRRDAFTYARIVDMACNISLPLPKDDSNPGPGWTPGYLDPSIVMASYTGFMDMFASVHTLRLGSSQCWHYRPCLRECFQDVPKVVLFIDWISFHRPLPLRGLRGRIPPKAHEEHFDKCVVNVAYDPDDREQPSIRDISVNLPHADDMVIVFSPRVGPAPIPNASMSSGVRDLLYECNNGAGGVLHGLVDRLITIPQPWPNITFVGLQDLDPQVLNLDPSVLALDAPSFKSKMVETLPLVIDSCVQVARGRWFKGMPPIDENLANDAKVGLDAVTILSHAEYLTLVGPETYEIETVDFTQRTDGCCRMFEGDV